jgi:hypothetical protein
VTVDEFKVLLLASDVETLVDTLVLEGESAHFPRDRVSYVSSALSAKFAVPDASIDIRVVGSAKVGFALMEKRTKAGEVLPRLRPFRPDSDIDLAILSPAVFELIWDELSAHANNASWMPWDSGRLGDYFVHGWLRPDHFPKNVRLRKCDDWWDSFRSLSADSRLGRRAIRGALFHSVQHLRRYQLRSLHECRSAVESEI